MRFPSARRRPDPGLRRPPARRAPASRAVLRVLLVALCVRALVPDGFMFGSFANGWPVVLCPDGLPAGYLAQLPGAAAQAAHRPGAHAPAPPERGHHADAAASGGHTDAGGHADPGVAVAQHCAWGAVLDKVALAPAQHASGPLPPRHGPVPVRRVLAPASARLRGPASPRAPPLV